MLKNYLTVILRNIRRRPVHTILNLSCLTIGIAGTLLILLYLDFELNYDSYHAHSDRIYRVATNAIKTHEKTIDVNWESTPAPLAPTIKQDYPGIEAYTRLYKFWVSDDVKFQFGEKALEEEDVYAADPTVFEVFTFDFISGDAGNALDGPNKIVLSESLAKRIFGGEEVPLGKILKTTLVHELPDFDPQYSFIVTGVYRDMPKNVHLYAHAVISSPSDPALKDYYFNRFNVFTYLLLFPQTDPSAIISKLSEIYTKYLDPARDPVLVSASHELTAITKIHIAATGGLTYIYIFSAVGLLSLLISGISYVNLITAQASRRALEIGLRKVMGSQRYQLISQFLAESLFLTLTALILAIGLVLIGMASINEMLNLNLYNAQLWQPQLIMGEVVIVLLLGILGGSYPAFFLASLEPVKVMKDTTTTEAPLRKILVSIQLAVVIFVLISTGMIYDQLQFLRKKDLGFDKEHIISLTIPSQNDPAKGLLLKNNLLQNPNILSTGTSDFIPGIDDMGRRPIAVDGSPGQEQKFVYFGGFDYDFLSTMNIQVVSGRNFSIDFPGDTSAIMINEALVRAFELKEPLGDKVRYGGKGNPKFFVIVGVVKDFHQSSLYSPIEPQMFVLRTSNKLFMKINNDIPSGLKHAEKSWAKIFPDSPFSFRFIEDELQDGYQGDQIRGKVFFSLSLLTVFIAFLGLFGLASYLASQRVKEIGIRKILGATLMDMVFLITHDFLLLVLMAAIPAFILSWYVVNQWLENFAFRTEINYTLFVLSLLFTLLLTFITTGLHAWRAASANPIKNLRHE